MIFLLLHSKVSFPNIWFARASYVLLLSFRCDVSLLSVIVNIAYEILSVYKIQ